MRAVTKIRKENRMPGSILSALVLALASGASAAVNAVKVTSVEAQDGKLIIHATAKPEFTVFKLSGPPRVVIDLNEGDVSAAVLSGEAAGHHSIHRAGIASWSAERFDAPSAPVGPAVVPEAGSKEDEATRER